MTYKIISTGSKGNAVIIDETILIDCGVPFTKLKDHYKKLKIVLLTHIHIDHFNKTTIKKLASERPTLRFASCEWLIKELVELGIDKRRIDIVKPDKSLDYGEFKIGVVLLYHNVENCGYRLFKGGKRLLYATDTNTLDGIEAENYDYYLIEANHTEAGIQERIKAKEQLGLYIYEYEAMKNHLSKEKADAFILKNAGDNSIFEYLHGHEER